MATKLFVKYTTCLAATIICMLLMVACSSEPTNTNQQSAESGPITDPSGLWTIEVLSSEVSENLNSSLAVVHYNGQVEEVPLEAVPSENKVFLIVELVIEKKEAGQGVFIMDNLYVEDDSENVFQRHPNDTFLEDFNLRRIKSIDLNFRRNEGFICFEIDSQSANSPLKLVYSDDEGSVEIPLALTQ